MAKYPFRLPDIGEGIAEAEIVAWHVKIGDAVEEDQPIADMMIDKATVEMTAPVAGTVVELAGAVGDTIAIGSVLVLLETGVEEGRDASPAVRSGERPGEDGDPSRSGKEAPAPTRPDASRQEPAERRVLASPAVRARAKDLGIDLATVRPAQGDRVRHADLDAYLRYGGGGVGGGGGGGKGLPASRSVGVETIRLASLRKRIAAKMAEAKRHIPHFTYVEACDVTALEALRAAMNADRGSRPKLSLLPFLIRAIVRAIPAHPLVNARFDEAGGTIERHDAVHLGLAAQTDGGLMVPVLRDAQALDAWQLAGEIARLAEGARAGRLSAGELSGSTITLSSLGALGGIMATPIINHPEVAIVGINRIVEMPVVVDGAIVVRKMMNLSSSFDHRIVDGHDAASFIQEIRRLIEQPALLFV